MISPSPSPSPLSLSSLVQMTNKFQSYSINIARSRRRYQNQLTSSQSPQSPQPPQSSYLTPVRSLLHTLQTETQSLLTHTHTHNPTLPLQTPHPQTITHFQKSLNRAL